MEVLVAAQVSISASKLIERALQARKRAHGHVLLGGASWVDGMAAFVRALHRFKCFTVNVNGQFDTTGADGTETKRWQRFARLGVACGWDYLMRM